MKHLKNFEKFNNDEINEWVGQKFITGHGPGEKEKAKKRIEEEIADAINKFKEHPDDFRKYDEKALRDKLLKDAKDNGYRGKVVVQKSKSGKTDKKFIVYHPKNTGLQDVGSAAAGR